METYSIEWHEERLKNNVAYLERRRESLKREAESIEQSTADSNLLELQIATAKREGKLSFDPDKYLKKRKRK